MSPRLLQAVTSVRVGEGTAVGAVALPVARERHTQWPFIPGSSLKGAFRTRASVLVDPKERDHAFERAFGSTADERAHRGEMTIGAATLLAMPVRTLQGGFVLLASSMSLARLARELRDAPEIPQPAADALWVRTGKASTFRAPWEAPASLGDIAGVVILEELDWLLREDPLVDAWAERLARWCGPDAPLDHLAVVSDPVFDHAVRAWTETRGRNRIAPDGVVADGALFSVESLPPDTLWWCNIDTAGHEDLLPDLGETFIVGGHQSTGMGRITWFEESP